MKPNSSLLLLLVALLLLAFTFAEKTAISIARRKTYKSLLATNAGVKTVVTQKAITYINEQFRPIIEQQIAQFDVDDIHDSTSTPIGKIHYDLTNIRLHSFKLGNEQVQITSTGILLSVQGSSATVDMNWHYKKSSFPPVSDHGRAVCSLGLDISMQVVVSVDPTTYPNSKLKVDIQNVNSNIHSFHLDLHGGASWLYQIFVNAFRHNIEKSVNSALHKALSKAIQEQMSKQLSKLSLIVPVGKSGINADFSARTIFYNATKYMTFGAGGEFQYPGSTFSGDPTPLPDFLNMDSMIQIMLSEWSLNSLGFALYKSGLLARTITNKDLPSSMPFKLNTATFHYLLPKLYQLYPDRDMQIVISADTPGYDIQISPDGAAVTAHVLEDFQVLTADGTIVSAFVLDLNLKLKAVASLVNNTKIVAQVTLDSVSLTVKSSNIGDISVSTISSVIKVLTEYVIVPVINAFAAQGFDLPKVDGLTLQDPRVFFADGFLAIISNFVYTPQIKAADN